MDQHDGTHTQLGPPPTTALVHVYVRSLLVDQTVVSGQPERPGGEWEGEGAGSERDGISPLHQFTRMSRSNTAYAQEHSTPKVGAWRRDFSHTTNVLTRIKRIEYPIQHPQDSQTTLSTRTHHAFRTEGFKKTSKIVLQKQLQHHTDTGDLVSPPPRDQQRRSHAWPCGAATPYAHPHVTHGQLSPPHPTRTLEVVCVNKARVDTFARQESNSLDRL